MRWRNFVTVLRRVLRTPFAAATLTLGILWGIVLHNSVWGAVGLGAAILAVFLYALAKLQDEPFIREALHEAREQERKSHRRDLEFRLEELDVESRIKMKSIVKLQNEIAEDIESSPIDEVAAGLADTVAQTQILVERGLSLAQKRRELQRYLNKTDDKAIELRIQSLQAKLAEESDAARRSELEISLSAKQQELADYQAIEAASERILAELDGIECSFASLRARLVRIKSTDISDWAAANVELQTELGGLNSAVDTLEQSINEALSTGSSG